jgi:Icc-related predicted phosphoesterase
VIRRVSLEWPDARPFEERGGRPIRLLAVSDEHERALEFEDNRQDLGTIDGIVGCGDLDPRWLAFLADSFCAPLVYVLGNHDRGGDWDERRLVAPDPLRSGRRTRLAGIAIAGLGWPTGHEGSNRRRPDLAWWQALRVARLRLRDRLGGRREPLLVISHAAPAGAGDAADIYHRGFPAYRWLLDRVRPPLWLHGHTTTASVADLEVRSGETTLINVTGAVLVELRPPGGAMQAA